MGCRPSLIRSHMGTLPEPVLSESASKLSQVKGLKEDGKKKIKNEEKQMEYSMMVNEDGYVSTGLEAEISDSPKSRAPSSASLVKSKIAQYSTTLQNGALSEDVQQRIAAHTEEKSADGEEEEGTPTSEQIRAATVLQAAFRGRRARKALLQTLSPDPEMASEQPVNTASAGEPDKSSEEVDIDLEDPDVEKAALKIQGAFKGLRARKSTGSPSPTPSPSSSRTSNEDTASVTSGKQV